MAGFARALWQFWVVHGRHLRRSDKGVWQLLFGALVQDADNDWTMVDSTIVRVHQHSAGAKKGVLEKTKPSAAAAAA